MTEIATGQITVSETEPIPADQPPGDLSWQEIRDEARRLLETPELDILATDGSFGPWYQGRIVGPDEAIWTHEGQSYSLRAGESTAPDSPAPPSISPQVFRSIVLTPLAALTPSETTKWGFGSAVELQISELDAEAWAPLVTIADGADGLIRVNFAIGIAVDNYTVVYDFRSALEAGFVGPTTPFAIQATFASPAVADQWAIDLEVPATQMPAAVEPLEPAAVIAPMARLASVSEVGRRIAMDDPRVTAELSAYINDRALYEREYLPRFLSYGYAEETVADQFEELRQEWAEWHRPVDVLIETLRTHGHLAHVDWKQAPDDVLMQLNGLSEGVLSKSDWYRDLLVSYQESDFGIAQYLEIEPDGALRSLIAESGFVLEAIDEGSDSYALVLLRTSDVEAIYDAADRAGLVFSLRDG